MESTIFGSVSNCIEDKENTKHNLSDEDKVNIRIDCQHRGMALNHICLYEYNVELLHECKSHRDELLLQVIVDEGKIDCDEMKHQQTNFVEEFNADLDVNNNLLHFIDLQDEMNDDHQNSIGSTKAEDLYIENTINSIVKTQRFVPLSKEKGNIDLNIENGFNLITNRKDLSRSYFIQATETDVLPNSKWQQIIKEAKLKAREAILDGVENLDIVNISISKSLEDNASTPINMEINHMKKFDEKR
ncbi:unnamed protein product [Rotaria sp. Silwood1]|nr:unnamed protein product [Rotaria sp. Silwood1]CAF1076769.1 unnamed protein product [Rotaria sp. Silwood1]CAF3438351.1 unnamed protein product [Rotaria sp. Silwood1]CAF3439173.1 unnamed protein product [Rotaria sp. Silwood1]